MSDDRIREALVAISKAGNAMGRGDRTQASLEFYDDRSTGRHGWGAQFATLTGFHESDPLLALRDLARRMRETATDEQESARQALGYLTTLV